MRVPSGENAIEVTHVLPRPVRTPSAGSSIRASSHPWCSSGFKRDCGAVLRGGERWIEDVQTPVDMSQIRTFLSHDPQRRSVSSGEKAMEVTKCEWQVNLFVHTFVVVFQRHTVQPDPDASRLPSREKATAQTVLELSVNVAVQIPDVRSQRRAVPSQDPDARWVAEGEKARDVIRCEWPTNVFVQAPVDVFHSRTALSSDADASQVPSGERVMTRLGSTGALWLDGQ